MFGPTHFSFADLLNTRSALYQLELPARLALLGTPVTHSRSPEIHNECLQRLHLPWRYVTLDVKKEELSAAFELLRKNNFIGFNVTMPHKQEAMALVDEITEHAHLLGAVNTVVIKDGKLYGSNTDGPGFVAALKEEWNLSLQDHSVLILGATGGTGSALAMQSALEGCRQLFLSSRTPSALQQQIESLSQARSDLLVEAISLDEASLNRVMPSIDFIINATSVGFFNSEPPSLIPKKFFQPRHYVYDIIYSQKPTSLLQAAQAAGAQTANGDSMLRLQAALSFNAWRDPYHKG